MNPNINRFYNKDTAANDNYWSPLVSVDLTLRDVSLCLTKVDYNDFLREFCTLFECVTAFEITHIIVKIN